MIAYIVINKHQPDYMHPMEKAIGHPGRTLFVLTDPDIEDITTAKELESAVATFIPSKRTEPDFHAGAARNYGYGYAKEMFKGTTTFVFLDGDRVPSIPFNEDSIEREVSGGAVLFLAKGGETRQPGVTLNCNRFENGFFSCGFAITRDAAESASMFQGGNLFHPDFDGYWGDEDRFLGNVLGHLGYTARTYSGSLRLGGNALTDSRYDKSIEYTRNVGVRMRLLRESGIPFLP